MSLPLDFVICAQWLIGFGIICRLRAVENGFSLIGLSMLTGLGVSSVVPVIVELVYLPIAPAPVFIGLGMLAVVSLLLVRGQGAYLRRVFTWKRLSVRVYELPFVGFWVYLLFISAWKCAWFPNTPFDTVVGPDLVATVAVREGTLASSVFTEHLPSVSVFSNQPFYAPFTAMQQIIYLLATGSEGPFMFGKLWLTLLVVSFGLFLYAELRERIHPILAGALVSLLACTPELFAYTFLVQTDWANAAFFAAGVLLLQRYLESNRRGPLAASALLLAIACWTRSETIFFAPIGSLCILVNEYKASVKAIQWPGVGRVKGSERWYRSYAITRSYSIRPIPPFRHSPKNAIKSFGWAAGFSLVCLLPVLFWNYDFLRGHIPLPPKASLGVIHGLANDYWDKLLMVFREMNKQVVFNSDYWNYAVPTFLVLTFVNLFAFRDSRGLMFLIWIIGLYALFGLIIQHVDGANVAYTFRRGFFKLLFLMYAYLGTTTLFRWLSGWLYRWEGQAEPI